MRGDDVERTRDVLDHLFELGGLIPAAVVAVEDVADIRSHGRGDRIARKLHEVGAKILHAVVAQSGERRDVAARAERPRVHPKRERLVEAFQVHAVGALKAVGAETSGDLAPEVQLRHAHAC